MKQGRTDARRAALDEAMARAWPDGVPASETVMAARLGFVRAGKLARRLDAVRGWEEAGDRDRPMSAVDAAAAADVGLSQFHALVAAWRRNRSLAALGVHAAEPRAFSRRLSPAARRDVVTLIHGAMLEKRDIKPLEVRGRIEAAGAPTLSDATLLRLMADARRILPPGAFGERLILDAAGLDFVDPEGLRVRLYGVVDHGTGMVLGWAVSTDRSGAMGHVWSAFDALERLAELDVSRLSVSPGAPLLDVRLDGRDEEAKAMVRARFGEVPSLGRATRTLGSTLVEVLGERIGGLWLGTGSRPDGVAYRTGRRVELPEYSADIALALDPAIERHNAQRIAYADCPPSAAVEGGRVRICEALERVLALEPAIRALPGYAWVAEREEDPY